VSAFGIRPGLTAIAFATGLNAIALSAAQASASGTSPHVAVAHLPTPVPVNIAGCWSADRAIYGPYHLSFCTDGHAGVYRVTGGLDCKGAVRLSTRADGSLTIRLGHGRCDGSIDWSADYLECRPRHAGVRNGWQGGRSGATGDVASPQVAVPRAPYPYPAGPGWSDRMDCTYFPVVVGYRPMGVGLLRN